MIREAVRADIPHLVVMGLRFVRSSSYAEQIGENPDALFDLMLKLIESPEAVIFISGEDRPFGMIGAHLYRHPMSGEITASELFWWVEPEHRGEGVILYRKMEEWARENAATKIQMIAPDDRTERAYCALGFHKLETHYQKALL